MTNSSQIGFKKRIFITGTLTVITGLHIGGNSTEMSIGGADHIVIRDPLTNHPYIPGSSLRGKMRSLQERLRGEMTIKLKGNNMVIRDINELDSIMANGISVESAGPSSNPSQISTKLFGLPIDKNNSGQFENITPQRLVIRDAKLMNPETLEKARNTDMPMTEVKTEVSIDRITSEAKPRQIERVPAGAKFKFEMVLNLYEKDDESEFLKAVFGCMDLLQDDYLGGHGSRGYGKVRFTVDPIQEKSADDYRNNHSARPSKMTVPETLQQ